MPRLPKRFTWGSRRTERRPFQGKQECLCCCRRRYDTSHAASQFPRLVFQTRYGGLSCAGGLRRIARFVAHKSSICVAGARHTAHCRTGGILRKFAACAKQKCTRLPPKSFTITSFG